MADVENEQQSELQLAGGVAEEEVPEKTAIDQINDGVEKVVLTTENQNSKKKNKKKKKKAAAVENEENVEVKQEEEKEQADKDLITETKEPVCAHCGLKGPVKRCSKRHPKCMKKMFCNESCETFAHKVAKPLAAATGNTDPVKKKKKKKIGERPTTEFWWNNSVFASW